MGQRRARPRSYDGFKCRFLRAEFPHLVIQFRGQVELRHAYLNLPHCARECLGIRLHRAADLLNFQIALDHPELVDYGANGLQRASERQGLFQGAVGIVEHARFLETDALEPLALYRLNDGQMQRPSRDLYGTGALLASLDGVTRICEQRHRFRSPEHHSVATRVAGEIADVRQAGD